MNAFVLDLTALGVNEQALTASILKQLGLTKEEAVKALAEKLGVTLEQPKAEAPAASSIKNGDVVSTADGQARAFILKSTDIAALANAARVLSAFSGNGKAS